MRYLFIGAHPDDPDVSFGGTAMRLSAAGHIVKFVSMTNGDRGHHILPPEELAVRRYKEAQTAAAFSGVKEYEILSNHDTELMPTLENRHHLIRLIRQFAPDVVVTHRTCDYHADHRACGQLVTDAAFLIGVPHCCPDTPVLRKTPVFCCTCDPFKRPVPFRADAVCDISCIMEKKVDLLLCHESQFLEWLPWIELGFEFDKEHAGLTERRNLVLQNWLEPRDGTVPKRFPELTKKYYPAEPSYAEAFEISEYGRQISCDEFQAVMTSF